MAKQADYVRYTIRVPADLYASVQEAAGEKSVNAEILTRLEVYDLLHDRIAELVIERDQLKSDLESIKGALDEQQKITSMLQQLIKEDSDKAQYYAEQDEEARSAIGKKYDDMTEQRHLLEGLKEELHQLLEERGDAPAARDKLLSDQAELIAQMHRTQRLTEQMIVDFRDAFLSAASGDEGDLRNLVDQFRKRESKAKKDD